MSHPDALSRNDALAALCEAHATIRIASDRSARLHGESAGGAALLRQRRVLEDEAIALLPDFDDTRDARRLAIASLSVRIAGALPAISADEIDMEEDFWSHGLAHMTPEELALYLSRGLRLYADQDEIFAGIDRIAEADPDRAGALTDAIAGAITSQRPVVMNDLEYSWNDRSIDAVRSPYWAKILRAVAVNFPDDFARKLAGALDRGEIDAALKYLLAGVPLGRIRPDNLYAREGRRLVSLMGSRHGRLAIMARAGDLETYLSGPAIETIEAFEAAGRVPC